LNLQDLLQKSLLALLLLPTLILAADRVGDFSLLDQNGYFHQMSWYDDNKAIVLLVQATGDIGVQNVLADFDSLNSSFDAQGIEFFMINPLGLKDRDAVKAEMVALNIDVPVLMDDARLISEALDIDKIGEVIVYDPKSF
jgi:hypothetical protein